jgi:hypothetical protein
MTILLFLLSIILLGVGLFGIIFAIRLFTDQGDVVGIPVFLFSLFSLFFGALGFAVPINERIENMDNNVYHVFVTDKFVKIATLSGDDMLQTTDHWTITNIDRHVVEKHQGVNLFGKDVNPPTYKLVEKQVEESNGEKQ